jgi:hypothetical protein
MKHNSVAPLRSIPPLAVAANRIEGVQHTGEQPQ